MKETHKALRARCRRGGQSLLEIIIALAIFALVLTALGGMALGGLTGLERGGEFLEAEALAEEGIEAVKAIYGDAWNRLQYATSSVSAQNGVWRFDGEGTTETKGRFTRSISFHDVCRNSAGDIVPCPGSFIDPQTKNLNVEISWETRLGRTQSISQSVYITNWDSRDWIQADWVGGSGQTLWADATRYDTGENVKTSVAGQVTLSEVGGAWVSSGGTEVTDTSDTDFNQGTFFGTVVEGSGEPTRVILEKDDLWAEHTSTGGGDKWNDVYAVSFNDAWTVGKSGKIYNWDGVSWTESLNAGDAEFFSIHCVTANNCWVAGEQGLLYHYDGSGWSLHTDTGNTKWFALSFAGSNDGWVGGEKGALWHFDGMSWSEVSSPTSQDINGIDAVSDDNVWAVGKNGTIIHYDGATWQEISSPTEVALNTVHMASASDGWATGEDGTIIHYDGATWQEVSSPTGMTLNAVHMVSASDGWATGEDGTIIHYDGASWSNVSSPTANKLFGVFFLSSTDGWAVGDKGTILKFGNFYEESGTFESRIIDGGDTSTVWHVARWNENLPQGADITVSTRTGNTSSPDGTWSNWSSELTNRLGSSIESPDARYLQYRLTLTRGEDLNQTPRLDDITIVYDPPTNKKLFGVFIVSGNNVWAVGENGTIIHYDGTDWAPISSPTGEQLNDVYMVSASDGWAVGKSGTIIHYDGATWQEVSSPTGMTLNAVHMVSASDGWAAGEGGEILRYDGVSWDVHTDIGNTKWHDLFFFTASDGWVVGDNGSIYHFDGATWTESANTGKNRFKGVYMETNSNGWAVGNQGLIFRFNGSGWTLDEDTGNQNWNAISLIGSPVQGWTVGDKGNIYKYEDAVWEQVTSPTSNNLNDVAMETEISGWAVGDKGTIIRFTTLTGGEFETDGFLISSAFDMGDASPVMAIEWDEQIPVCNPLCTVKFELSTAPDDGGFPGGWTSWQGPDGAGTKFSSSTGESVPTTLNGNQWVRYRASLTGDQGNTPVLDEVRVNYK